MSGSQHRCVFVGNIPYDATEEQLIQICEEVGPVVSFRLVVDRETGKPKGYGFCEFRDEETAASARRNLKGYEINGRPLRVDIAANEKGGSGDRSREQGLQGRGGPGLPSTNFPVDNQKPALPFGGGAAEQPIGYAAAAAAAAVMAGALGSSHHVSAMAGQGQNLQQGTQMNGHGSGVLPGNDALTSHLASMSKQQLYGIMSQMKALIQQNQQQARQILVANPQLTKALFQAQIMLGMVRPPQTSQVHAGQQAPLPPPQPVQSQSQTQGPQPPQPPTMPSQPFMYSQQSSSLPQSQLHPPLPQQPRPPVPPPVPPPMPPHLQSAQNLGFQPSPPQQLSFQHGVPQFSMGMAYPPQAQPPLPPQPPPQLQSQQIYQSMMANSASRMATDLGGSTSHAQGGLSTSAGILGSGLGVGPQGQAQHIRGPGMGPASGPVTGAVGLSSGNMDSVGGGGGERNFPNVPPMGSSNPYGQPPSMQGPPQPPLSFFQIQAMGLEQQKALLQQVMKLTPEQIESLPSEHRQQVLQLQQALNLKL